MTPLALVFLSFVCSTFVTTAEINHVHDIIDEIYDDVNPNSKLLYLYGRHKSTANEIVKDEHIQPTRYYNVKDDTKKNKGYQSIQEDLKASTHKYKITNVKRDRKSMNFNKKTIANMRQYNVNARRKRETNVDPRCQSFTYVGNKRLTHPKPVGDDSKPGEGQYASNVTCFTTIEVPSEPTAQQVIELTFVDVFDIENSHKCENDYLEIRNGRFGYAEPVYRFCGNQFPPQITSTGPYLWLKFHSDDSIERAGFTIDIDFPAKPSKSVPLSCYKRISGISGTLNATIGSQELEKCREDSGSGPLDVQWRIETDPGTQIYLNITKFQLANTNNCTKNTLQIFGSQPDCDHILGEYCSSVAKSLWTEDSLKHPGPANIMYIRFYTIDRTSNFSAVFTKFRTADSCTKDEYDCKDATCIHRTLSCDGIAHCRLKADEDPVECKDETQSLVQNADTFTILIVFSLILSAMISVFLFKCIKKVYQDQKKINEHRAQLCEFLKSPSQLTLPKSKDSSESPGSGHSLQEQNHANERNTRLHQQSSSLESDLLRMHIDGDWPESVPILTEDRLKYKGRPTKDLSRKEEAIRGKGSTEEKECIDEAVGAQELQEAECQTRESLYQTAPIVPRLSVPGPPGSRASGVPPPAPAPPPAPRLTVELLRQATAQDTSSSQADGRPLSSETTKSAPDVIQIY